MKLSFSLPSKPSSKQQTNLKPSQNFKIDEQDPSTATNKEYVTEFDPSKTLADAQQSTKLVIPPKPNEWRPRKKMKNLDLPLRPSDGSDLRFEVESASVADGGPTISYGLNLRNSDFGSISDANKFESDDPPPPSPSPAPVETVMLQKLKEDLKMLPDDRGLDEYTDMPVEGFGAALLAGYGWYEGRGIGRNAKEDVKVVQYERRTAKEGIGFLGDMPINNSGSRANAGKKEEKKKQISSRREDEEEKEGRFSVGKVVRIVGGRDVGLKGRIVKEVGGGDSVVLRLSRSEEDVKVRIGNIAELGSVEEEKCLRKLKELKIQGSNDEMHGNGGGRTKVTSSRHNHRESKKDNKRSSSREEGRRSEQIEEIRTSQVSWLTSHIRVRIISKQLKGGRLYLKKGEVVDMVGPTTCDISMDESRELIQGVDQELLETVLPRRGGPVLVLYGKHKGVYGSLVERDMENETGVVRDADSHELHNVRLQQIAEYMGDPSYIGY